MASLLDIQLAALRSSLADIRDDINWTLKTSHLHLPSLHNVLADVNAKSARTLELVDKIEAQKRAAAAQPHPYGRPCFSHSEGK